MLNNLKSTPKFINIFRGTRNFCAKRYPKESTFGLIKPDGMKYLGPIFDIIHEEGFYIRNLKMSQFTKERLKVLYEEHVGKDYYPAFSDFMVSGPVIGMRLGRLDAVKHWREVVGPTDPQQAKKTHPKSIRALYGTNERVNVVHGADKPDTLYKEIEFFFGPKSLMERPPIKYPDTILTLPPPLIQSGKLGSVIEEIQKAGCEINAMQAFDSDELTSLSRKLGEEDAKKIIRKKVTTGNSILLDISHKKGYDKLLEEMLRIENIYGTGFSHFDRGDEKFAEKVWEHVN